MRRDQSPDRQGNLTRREFLALGAAGGAAGAFSFVFGPALAGRVRPGHRHLVPADKDALERPLYDHVIRTACTVCPAACGLLACTRGSQLVVVRGDPDHPRSRGRLCLRALGAVNAARDPERLRTPLRRTGRRGEGAFEPVSWDEALDELAGRLRGALSRRAAVLAAGREPHDAGLLERFCTAMDLPMRYRPPRPHWAEPDFDEADAVLNLGGRLLEGELGPAAAEAVVDLVTRRGGTLLTVDPYLTLTASRSRTWYPVEPGREGHLALAVFRSLLAPQYEAVDIAEALPFLAPFEAGATERYLGLPRGTVDGIARVLARARRPVVYAGLRALQAPEGLEVARAASLFDGSRKGVLGADALDPAPLVDPPAPPLPVLPRPEQPLHEVVARGGAEVLLLSGLDPAARAPACEAWASRLADEKKVPFLAVHADYLHRTARPADLVLPLAGAFEIDGLAGAGGVLSLVRPCSVVEGEYHSLRTSRARGRPFVRVRDFATPPGRARSLPDLLLGLARRFPERTGPVLDYPDTRAYIEEALDRGLPPEKSAELREKGHVAVPERPRPDRRARPPASGPGLSLGPAEEEDASSFRLALLPAAVAGPGLENSKWLREMRHSNPLLMNRASARALDLADGDEVAVSSSRGRVRAAVRTTEGLHPKVVALRPGFGEGTLGRTARGRPFASPDRDTAHLWWGGADPGPNPFALLEPRPTGFWNLPAVQGERVRVEKTKA